MVLYRHELKRSIVSMIIWSSVIAFMLFICVVMYPLMVASIEEMNKMLSEMEGFSEAFGTATLDLGRFIDYFAVECGDSLGLGGALFAAITAINMLAKEEKDGTAEFLLTHPISRKRVITEKLVALSTQIVIFNLAAIVVSVLSILLIGESLDYGRLMLMFLGYFILQIEIAAVAFGLSAFIKKGGVGIGLGLALMCYFMNIVANITEDAEFLKYITPFGYADGASIASSGSIEWKYLLCGIAFAVLGILMAYRKYMKKDIK